MKKVEIMANSNAKSAIRWWATCIECMSSPPYLYYLSLERTVYPVGLILQFENHVLQDFHLLLCYLLLG